MARSAILEDNGLLTLSTSSTASALRRRTGTSLQYSWLLLTPMSYGYEGSGETPLEDCQTVLPDPLRLLHNKFWRTVPKIFVELAAGPSFVRPEGPYTPEGRRSSENVSKVIADPRLRHLPDLAVKLADAIGSEV